MMSNIDGVNNGFNANPSILRRTGTRSVDGRYKRRTGDLLQEIATINRPRRQQRDALCNRPWRPQHQIGQHYRWEYLRWIQMGALSPIFRPHVMSGDTGRMPWLRAKRTNIYREYLNLRYRFLPVFYQLAHENYETGLPIVRMLFDYRNTRQLTLAKSIYAGEDILIAPVIDTTKKGPAGSMAYNRGRTTGPEGRILYQPQPVWHPGPYKDGI